MAEGVVDELEPVEVDEQQRHLRATAGLAGQRLGGPFEEQRPVGQAGQRVVHGQLGDLGQVGHVVAGMAELELGDRRDQGPGRVDQPRSRSTADVEGPRLERGLRTQADESRTTDLDERLLTRRLVVVAHPGDAAHVFAAEPQDVLLVGAGQGQGEQAGGTRRERCELREAVREVVAHQFRRLFRRLQSPQQHLHGRRGGYRTHLHRHRAETSDHPVRGDQFQRQRLGGPQTAGQELRAGHGPDDLGLHLGQTGAVEVPVVDLTGDHLEREHLPEHPTGRSQLGIDPLR